MGEPLDSRQTRVDDPFVVMLREMRRAGEHYADLAQMRDLRQTIESFLLAPPARMHTNTLNILRQAVVQLKDKEDHILAVWD